MRVWFNGIGGAPRLGQRLSWLAMLALSLALPLALIAVPGRAADTPAAPPAAAATPAPAEMSSAGWLEHIAMKLEQEAMSDISMLPDLPAALEREWRSFDRNGSALGALVGLGWVVLTAGIALGAEKAVAWGLSRRPRRAIRARLAGPTLGGLLLLLICDMAGVAVFAGVFVYSRHWLMRLGVTLSLVLFAASVLIYWRIAALVISVVLRPNEPIARLIDVPDDEARRLARFLSGVVLAAITLKGVARMSLADEDSGAPHVIGLFIALIVCGLYTLIVFRARTAAEALIRGRRSGGVMATLRAGIARAWLAIGLTAVAGLLVFFVFGLSLGLLSYFRAVTSTLGVLFLLLVLGRLAERVWHDDAEGPATLRPPGGVAGLMVRTLHHLLRAVVLLVAAITLAGVWIDAIELPAAETARAMQSAWSAALTVFVAYVAWELGRLAIERHLQNVGGGPKLPGADAEEELTPGSRLQTMLPMLRLGFGVVIAVLATLIVLSRLGVDTAPLIAGAGIFGLAISFGSQSLVRDIISGVFYMWDDAFRVGEYIDTGRLKGTVEALGVRSVKLRHHNGPLHTIPYGQLGAVTNQSRDFATIKFNLRLEPNTDVELVRKTVKRIGLDMQENPEVASEVILPLKMQGIAEVADTAVVFRFKFTARPVKPSWVQREYLKQMYRVFAEKGISFASGTLMLKTGPMSAAEDDAAPRGLAEAMASPAAVPPASRVA